MSSASSLSTTDYQQHFNVRPDARDVRRSEHSGQTAPGAWGGQGRLGLSPAVTDFLAGGVAGTVAMGTAHPLDTVRVMLQQQGATGASSIHGSTRKGMLGMLRSLVAHEGVPALWKGVGLPVAFASFQNAIMFQVYGHVLRLQTQQQGGHSSHSEEAGSQRVVPTAWHGFLGGASAGLAQVMIWSPVELIKVRQQLQPAPRGSPEYLGLGGMLKKVWRHEGLAGLYRGVTVTALRDTPGYGVYFGMYHALVPVFEGKAGVHPDDAKPLTHVAAGGTAGCISWMSVYYLDVIKTRMQSVTRHETPGRTWMDFARDVWREGGARGMLRGITPTLARAFLMDGIAFLGYAETSKFLSKL